MKHDTELKAYFENEEIPQTDRTVAKSLNIPKTAVTLYRSQHNIQQADTRIVFNLKTSLHQVRLLESGHADLIKIIKMLHLRLRRQHIAILALICLFAIFVAMLFFICCYF